MNSNGNRVNSLECDSRRLQRLLSNHMISSKYSSLLQYSSSTDEHSRKLMNLAGEEYKVKKEVVDIILSGNIEFLRPNSGQAVNIAGHNICVRSIEDNAYGERAWEWHGHIMNIGDNNLEFRPEYFHGFYIEKVLEKGRGGSGNTENGRLKGVMENGASSNEGRSHGRNLKIKSNM